MCKLLIEANAGKVERALQEAVLMSKEEDVHIEEPVRMDMVEEPVSIRRRAR